jgi:hypothetical protein
VGADHDAHHDPFGPLRAARGSGLLQSTISSRQSAPTLEAASTARIAFATRP